MRAVIIRLIARRGFFVWHGTDMFNQQLLDLIQWPAMFATLLAAWLVASSKRRKRRHGFWWFIASNILWVIWGWQVHAYALIVLQAGLLALNIRGTQKNEAPAHSSRR